MAKGKLFKNYVSASTGRLSAYMKDRMAEADGLQRVDNSDEFYRKLSEFNEKWDVYKMAAKLRQLS